MSLARPRIPYTYEDYKSLPESMDRRYELLNGELYMVPAPTTFHQRISRNLGFILVGHAREHGLGEVLYSPIDVVFGTGKERDVAQPDIIFVSKDRSHLVTEQEIHGAPDLVVEVLSPGTEERDRTYKKTLYARHAVREYWIIDPDERTLERYLHAPQGYGEPQCYGEQASVETPLLPGLAVPLDEVFNAR